MLSLVEIVSVLLEIKEDENGKVYKEMDRWTDEGDQESSLELSAQVS